MASALDDNSIIRPRDQSIFDVSEEWILDLLFKHERLYQLS